VSPQTRPSISFDRSPIGEALSPRLTITSLCKLVKALALVPLRERHAGIVFEARIIESALDADPRRLGVDEAMHVFGWKRERRVDRTCVRVHKFRPGWIPDPQRASAVSAEVAPRSAEMSPGVAVVGELRTIDAQVALASYVHAPCHSTEVDCVAASTRSLPANRAVAPHEGNGFRRLDRELDFAAMA